MQLNCFFCTFVNKYKYMLLQFSVKNFKSFNDKATLSLIATNYDKETREEDNIHYDQQFGLRILKSAVVYGANGSGKSTLLEALGFMKYLVISSSKESQQGDEIDVEPFKLNDESDELPSEFEAIFIHNNKIYRYGFEVNKLNIISEWLYYKAKTKEIEIFYRDKQNFETHSRNFSKGKAVIKEGLVRSNALLLSVSAQFNDNISTDVIDWFKDFKYISGLNESGYRGFTLDKTDDSNYKKNILNLLKAADLGIQDIQLQKLDIEDLPKDLPKDIRDRIIKGVKEDNKQILDDIFTFHKKYDSNKNVIGKVGFSLDEEESSGTRKFFALTGPILDVIEKGYTLCIDELDSQLHPNLVCKIVSLFNSQKLNKKNAQLIFNTHDTNLLNSGLFRRDQFWFTDKNKFGESKLYSLADFKSNKVKKTEPFEENYIKGKYGAVPYLGFFDSLINTLSQYEDEK